MSMNIKLTESEVKFLQLALEQLGEVRRCSSFGERLGHESSPEQEHIWDEVHEDLCMKLGMEPKDGGY